MINETTPRITKTTMIKNIFVEGVENLRAERHKMIIEHTVEYNPQTRKFEGVQNILTDDVEELCFVLKEVSIEELDSYRKTKTPSFVLKKNGKLYHGTISKDCNLSSAPMIGTHMCSSSSEEQCKRLSAASDADGGCAKIRNHRSDHIERYDFIKFGYETFGTQHNCFVVINCVNYKQCPPYTPICASQLRKYKISLAQFVWEDITSIKQIREMKSNYKKYLG